MKVAKNDPLRPFIESVLKQFNFLIEEYGFQHASTDAAAYEGWVTFENATTRVVIHYEMGSSPCVAIGRIEQRDGRAIVPKEVSLELLLKRRGKSDVEPTLELTDIPDAQLDTMLRVKAANLRNEADDLLRGRFESLPTLMKEADENAKKRNLEVFGTESGETRR